MPSAPATSTYGKAPSPLQTSTGALAGAIPDRGCAHIPWCAAGNAVLKVNHSCGLHVGWIIDFVARDRLPAMYQLRENVLAAGQGFAGWLLNRRPLPACMTVLNVIGNLLTDSCQVKELFLG